MRSHAHRSVICATFIGAFAVSPVCFAGCADTHEFDEAAFVELLAIANEDAPFEFEYEGKHYRLELDMQRARVVDETFDQPQAREFETELQPITMSVDQHPVMPLTASVRLLRVEAAGSSELVVQAVIDGNMWTPGPSLRPTLIFFDSTGRADGFAVALRSPDAKHFQLNHAVFRVGLGVIGFSAPRPEH